MKTLTPVRGKWELAWGPATSRFGGLVDSSVMYVVRHTTDRERYVVAIRGTNPISVRDWTLGDVNVATLVEWPFATDGSSLLHQHGFRPSHAASTEIRSFMEEFIHQHLDAYLDRFGLIAEMDALTFFLG